MRAVEAASDALYRVNPSSEGTEAKQRRADAVGLVAERSLAAGFGGESAEWAQGAEGGEGGESPERFATAGAAFRDATSASRTPITSGTGPTVERPSYRIPSCCVVCIIASCTRGGTGWTSHRKGVRTSTIRGAGRCLMRSRRCGYHERPPVHSCRKTGSEASYRTSGPARTSTSVRTTCPRRSCSGRSTRWRVQLQGLDELAPSNRALLFFRSRAGRIPHRSRAGAHPREAPRMVS